MWMATLAVYGWYTREPGPARYLILLITFALGLMSKPMLVTLPFVLLLLDYWPLERMRLERGKTALSKNLRLLWEKLPLLALSAAASIVAVIMQQRSSAVVATSIHDMGDRVSNALLAYTGYLQKTIWPTNLAVFYPYPSSFSAIEVQFAFVVLLGISVCALLWLRRRPYFAVGWLWFLGTLVPVIGLVHMPKKVEV